MGVCLSISAERVTGFGSTNASSAGKEEDNWRWREKPEVRQRENGRRRKAGIRQVPCGKRTDFGFNRDFANRYTIGRLLGHGHFGYTFVAIDRVNGDRVAVKRIDRNKMVFPVAVEDVKREVKILEALRGHENVVHFYNAFEDDDYVYIVMELCQGGELLDRILAKKYNRYSEKDAAKVVRQMLKVAAECHLHGLVHRDMKPENFLFKSTKEDSPLKATDFGLSDFIKPGKKFHDIVGSAYYVAPEVLKRKSGPESDVWSIGVITYILLCGRRPFWDRTEDGIFKEALAKDIPWTMMEPRVLEILEAIDSNTDGLVDFSEFVAAALHVHQLEQHDSEKWQQYSKAAFEKFDIDKDGYISSDELRMYIGMKGSIETLLEEADIDKDGKISLAEFRHMLMTASMNSSNVPSMSVPSSRKL